MTFQPIAALAASAAALFLTEARVAANEITSPRSATAPAAFDLTRAAVSTDGRLATFALEVTGIAGADRPTATGALAGAGVAAYVWPTGLDPAVVGFAPGSGILALAVTAHPDFDDTPLFDEDGDGDPANDGADWHAHWVVLAEDAACGAQLKVLDIEPGVELLPATAPGLPLALDSPGMSPLSAGNQLRLTVPLAGAEGAAFDAVTATLVVNPAGDGPFLCVATVHDLASEDLSMPGVVRRAN